MSITETPLPGVLLVEPKKFHDHRGYFFEVFRESTFKEIDATLEWKQDNCSFSHKGVLRGLHYQWPKPQGKLVQALTGTIWDVAVDIRIGSPTFGQWHAEELNEENRRQLWIPPGFAHGFVVLSDSALVSYKCTDYFDAPSDGGIKWDDPDIGIDWPLRDVVVSTKDENLPRLAEAKNLPTFN
jgi:dTDP-4-dehydrorhamnose 3,5-epimerase